MTPEQFCYWLQGYFELSPDTDRLSQREHIIRDHLKTVFEKKTREGATFVDDWTDRQNYNMALTEAITKITNP